LHNDQLKAASNKYETYSYLDIDTLGFLNGCVDLLYEAPHYPRYALNNTYDLPAITEDTYEQQLGNYSAPDGCAALLKQCRELAAEKDPLFVGNDLELNELCVGAFGSCISSQGVATFLNVSPSSRILFGTKLTMYL
jgi:carboxypeptidase D